MANYQTITSDKNKDMALILCIFGGVFGLHQFYVGKIGKGIIYLCTLGLFCFGWIGDIIKILLGTFKDNTGMPLRATKKQNNRPTNVRIINQEVEHQRQEDSITQIEKLAELKNKGIITQAEFEKKKKELLK